MLHVYANEHIRQLLSGCSCAPDVYVYELPQYVSEIPAMLPENSFAVIEGLMSLEAVNRLNVKVVPTDELVHAVQALNKPAAKITIQPEPVKEPILTIEPVRSEPEPEIARNPLNKPPRVPEFVPEYPEYQPSNFMARNTLNPCEILASFSTKGGAGKTVVATNLGVHHALTGHKTVLLDMDIGTGNAGTVLGVLPAETNPYKNYTGPTVENWREFARNLAGSMKRHKSGLYVLPCGPRDYELREAEVEDLLDNLSSNFDYIVLDFGTKPFFPHTRRGLELATKVYVVALQDQGVTEALVSQFLSEREEWVRSGKACLVVNRVSPLGYYKPMHIAKMAGFKNWVEIPDDPQSFEAAKRSGKAVIQLPNSAAGRAFGQIVGEEVTPEKSGLLSNLLRKRGR